MGTKIFSGNILQIVCSYLAQPPTVLGILSIRDCTAVRSRNERTSQREKDRQDCTTGVGLTGLHYRSRIDRTALQE